MADTDTDPATYSGSDRLADFQHAREASQPFTPDEDRWLVGYQHNRMNSTVLLGGFNPALTNTLRSKRWATLVRDSGWVIPARYLAHVERLLAGADVDLFDVEGGPTPAQRERERDTDRAEANRVLAEIHEARDLHEQRSTEAHKAYLAAREAMRQALARKHANDEQDVAS